MGEISEYIRKIVKGKEGTDLYTVAKVKAVNGVFIDASPVDGTADLKGIRLCAADDSKVFIVIPKVGSIVYIQLSSPTDGIVVGFSEVDEIYLRGQDNHGLVKVADLVTRLNLIENNQNALITAFNALVTVYSAHFHIPGGPPPLTPGVPYTVFLEPTVQAEIENTKVKHG